MYLKKFKTYLNHPLFAGSAVMVIGNNIFNGGQLVYQILSVRLLETSLYGDFAAIISILGIIGVVQIAFGLTIVKFVATQKSSVEVSNLIKWFSYWGFLGGFIAAAVMLLFSPLIGKFLNLTEPSILFLLPIMFFFFIIVYIYRSILLGLLSFKIYVLSLIVDVIVKIIATGLLVFLGMKLLGAMLGLLFGVVVGFIVARLSISRFLKGKKKQKPEIVKMLRYSLPVLIQNLAFTSMFSTDILLVKHFFSPIDAGTYAYLSVLGRIAMYCSSPITQTMFPLVAKRFAENQQYKGIFYLSLFLITAVSIAVVIFFKMFPNLPVSLLGKSVGGEILWWFGLFMTLLGISLVFVQFYLSIDETRPVWFFVLAALLQAVSIWFFHTSLLMVVQMSIISASLLVVALLVYWPYRCHES